jgi:hypothetical protein
MLDATTPNPLGARPCFWTVPDATSCASTPTGLALRIERTSPPPQGTVIQAECAMP